MNRSFLIFALIIALFSTFCNGETKIEESLVKKLQHREKLDVIVSFTSGTQEVLESHKAKRFLTRSDKLASLRSNLLRLAEKSQKEAVNLVRNQYGLNHTVLWISNQLSIKEATVNIISDLVKLPDVKYISEEEIITLETPEEEGVSYRGQDEQEAWGIQRIQAPLALQLLHNSTSGTSSNIIVATIDTGVRHTHVTYRDQWVGPNYGWYDPYYQDWDPIDTFGHGTHTLGTLVGKYGIGAYPEASWMSCRGCLGPTCTQTGLLSCAQHLLCPTNPDGANPRCDMAPRVINNSWGSGRAQTWFNAAIQAWNLAGIISVFAIGNAGPTCSSANSPGDSDQLVISVGSTTSEDALAPYSSIGPALASGRLLKPEITAPGSGILSAFRFYDDEYREQTGTSMAAPHVAGVVALLLGYNDSLTYEDILYHLKRGADTYELIVEGRVCGDRRDDVFPNNHFGYGRLNAYKALKSLITFESQSNVLVDNY